MTIVNQEVASRVRILDAPSASPGVCVICGIGKGNEGENRTFVDFGQDIEFYGAVYFCSFCFSEVARSLGFMAKEDYENLVKTVEAQRDHINENYAKEKLTDEFLDNIKSLSSSYSSGASMLLSPLSVVETVQDESRLTEDPITDDPESVELTGKQGSSSVSGSTSNDLGIPGFTL